MTGGPAHKSQLTKLVLQLRDLGVTGRPRRLAVMTALLGRDLFSARDLTVHEATQLIDRLDRMLTSFDPIAELAAATFNPSEVHP